MGKKNKFKKPEDDASGNAGRAPPQQQQAPPQQQQAPPAQQEEQPGSSRQNQQKLDGASGKQSQQQPRPQQQPQQQGGAWPQQGSQQRQQQGRPQQPQQQQQQQRPQQSQQPQQQQQGGAWSQQGSRQQQRPEQRPQQQQQQQLEQRPQQQQQQQPQQQQQRQQQQQQRPQQQQQRPQQQQQRPEQRQQGGSWSQQGSQQQQRPEQRPQQQQGGSWSQQGSQQQQRPEQRPQQQQGGSSQQGSQSYQQQTRGAVPKPQQQQQQGRQQYQQQPQQSRYPAQQPTQSPHALSSSSSSASFTSTASVGNIQRGTKGQATTVETNYLELNLSNMPSVAYHYDIIITPDRPKKFMRPAFDEFNRVHFKNIAMAFDGRSSFYTIEKLPCNEFEKEVELDDTGSRKITFMIAVQATGNIEIDLASLRTYFNDRIYEKPMRALQCLEVVLASPCHNKGTRAGRSFFNKPSKFYDLEGGYEMWTGLFQAAILGDKPFLNVDIAHKSFPTACRLVDYIKNYLRGANLNQSIIQKNFNDLSSFLKNTNVVYEPPKCFNSPMRTKTFRVNRVLNTSAIQTTFESTDPQTNKVTKTTVAAYYAGKGYRLQYENLNLLHVGPETKNIYLPMELCSIPEGQALNRKDGKDQVAKMIRYACTSTNERKDKIMAMLRYFNHNADSKIHKFGIQIGSSFIEIPMRILESPKLEYLNREMAIPSNGSWRMRDRTMFFNCKQPKTLEHKWGIIYSNEGRFAISYHILEQFGSMVSSIAKQRNIYLAAKPYIDGYNKVDDTLSALKRQNYDLVFVVIPKFGTTYAKIKTSAEIKQGILTQCIKHETLERRLDANLVLNVLLKVNAKLNGTNHKIAPDRINTLKNVMYLGADVTHPSPDQKHIPSVVGVAASHDEYGACYNMQYRLQRSTVENIEDMSSIFTEHLKEYYNKQRKYPDHVIYYRDGVSDGQFPIVKNNELKGIREACKKMKCAPKLTCIIVVKRHHTRFFPKSAVNPNDRGNKFNNVTPGTVVDRVIVHPNEVQFFMVSHQSIQGTAKPTRYNVIEDDANLNIDLLQSLTYNLCHMFPRCNRVVSYPAPAYLAHLVAFRGRVYLDEDNFENRNLSEEYRRRQIQPIFKENNPMFFV